MKELVSGQWVEIEEKKSKFLGLLIPYLEFKEKLELLREEHPKARHFVYATRSLNEANQIVENLTDDGEPKGSSGKPILNVLKGHELINVALIVVRYFGGTKLGVGGLVRAYTECAQTAVLKATFKEYIPTKTVTFELSYANQNQFLHLLQSYNGRVIDRIFDESIVKISIIIAEENYQVFANLIKERRVI